MDGRNKINRDRAYACHVWTAMIFLFVAVFDLLMASGNIDFTTFQGLGMIVGIPLVMLTMIVVILGFVFSLMLWKSWRLDWGPPVLLALLIIWASIYFVEEEQDEPYYWLNYATAIYVLATTGFAGRWFFRNRKQAG